MFIICFLLAIGWIVHYLKLKSALANTVIQVEKAQGYAILAHEDLLKTDGALAKQYIESATPFNREETTRALNRINGSFGVKEPLFYVGNIHELSEPLRHLLKSDGDKWRLFNVK